jgi:phenylacetyl-CoA:acceptor oxidoreductase
MAAAKPQTTRSVASYCYQCVAGPDLLTVEVADGVATEIRPNHAAAAVHPAGGKVCVKAFGLIQKTYNPNRVLSPMKRTNPVKGREHEPNFVPISWDEALDTIAAKLRRFARTGCSTPQDFRASRQASAAAARQRPTWGPFPPSWPPGARST